MPSNSKSLYAPSGSTAWTLSVSWSVSSQSTADNTSTISAKATLKSDQGSFSSGSSNTLAVYWHDNNTNSDVKIKSGSYSSWSAGASKSVSGTKTVSHKADGTLSGYAKAVWTKSDGNSWTPASGNVSTSNTALTTIPRKSTPSMGATSYTATTTSLPTLVVNTNRASSSFTHTASININGTSYTMATKSTAASISWTMTSAARTKLLAAIPNATQYTATVTLTTYSGDTSLGSATCTTVLKINNSYKPTIGTPATTEQNTTVTNISGFTNGTIVANLSSAKVGVTASSNGSSTISSVKIQNGTVTKTATLTSGTYYATFAANELKSATFTATATDSRGYTNTSTYTGTYVSYINPSITQVDVHRLTSTSSTTSISVSGNWYNGSIGNVQNTITVKYQYARIYNPQKDYISTAGADYDDQYVFYDDKVYKCTTSTPSPAGAWDSTKWQEYTGYTTLTPTTNGNTYTATNSSGLTCEYQYNYKVKVQVNDAINGVIYTSMVGLNSAIPVLWLGERTVRVGGAMIPNLLGMDYEFTSLGNSESPTGLGLIDGNKFKQVIDGRTFYLGSVAAGASATYTLPFDGHYEIITVSSYKTHCSRWLVATGGKNAMFQSDGFGQWAHTESDTAGNMNGALSITNSNYAWYDYNSGIDRTNGVVSVHLIVKPVATESTTGSKTIANVLKGYLRPQTLMRAVCQGSNQYTFCATINTNGNIAIERYGYGTTNVAFPASAWLNIFMTYIAQTHPVLIDCDNTDGKIITVSPSDATIYVYARYLPRYY